MSGTKRSIITSAVLDSGQSIPQLVVGHLLDGLILKLMIDGKSCDGLVHNLDLAPRSGSDFIFASVTVPELNQGDNEFDPVKVSIHRDGTVNILPDPPKK